MLVKDSLQNKKKLYLSKFLNPKKKSNQPTFSDDLKLLRGVIKNLNYEDIILSKCDVDRGSKYFCVNFNNDEINNSLEKIKEYHKDDKLEDFDIVVSVDTHEFNRIHFHSHLPKILTGIGLGYKIYKSIGSKLGYITSDNTASKSAQKVWFNLIQDKDFNYILSKNFVLIMKDNLPTNKKRKIIKDYFDTYDWIADFPDEIDIDSRLVDELKDMKLRKLTDTSITDRFVNMYKRNIIDKLVEIGDLIFVKNGLYKGKIFKVDSLRNSQVVTKKGFIFDPDEYKVVKKGT